MTQMKNTILALAIATMSVTGAAWAAELPKALIDPYLQIQAALANDKFDEVALQAKAIEVAATALGGDADKLAASANKLGAAKDIATARTTFGDLSDALIAYAEKTKSELGADVKVAYCPMVNKPWLQKDKEIKNPYYGASMLTCGSFKK
jgi:Protein of unknown function (DUF3347)